MSQSMLLPAFVALFGVVAALFLRGFRTDRAVPAHDPDLDVLMADPPARD